MKITDVRVEKYRWPKNKPIKNGKHIFTHNELNLVIIETDENITGLGTSYNLDYVEYLKPFLIGEDPLNNEYLWKKMYVPKFLGRRSVSTRSISAIDIALWDIKSKVAGIPLYKLIGGAQSKAPAYIAGGYYADDKGIKELQQEMEEYLNWGVKAVKMKVGAASMEEDIARVKAVREIIGDDIHLMLDANCAYFAFEAIEFSKRVEQYNPYWFEEPVMPDDYNGLIKVSKKSPIPIATGENEYTKHGFRDLLSTQAVDILNPDAATLGGITEFIKVCAMAESDSIPLSPHGQQQVHTHLACAIPNVLWAEYYPPSYDRLINDAYINPVILNDDGTISAPESPGVGLDIDFKVLEKYRV